MTMVEPLVMALAARPYEPPTLVYKAALEVRAGSPLGIPVPPLGALRSASLWDSAWRDPAHAAGLPGQP